MSGRVLDVRGNPVRGVRIELWQANAAGRYRHAADTSSTPLDPNFQGVATLASARDGRYRYTTIKSGAYNDGDDSPRPPHIHLDIRGRTDRVVTQMIFPGEPLNERDDVIPPMGEKSADGCALGTGTDGALRYEWDIILARG